MSRASALPNAENCSKLELELATGAASSRRSHDRLRAMKSLVLGIERKIVCELFAIDDRTLRRWVWSFNAYGIDGLIESERTGRPRAITLDQTAPYQELILNPTQASQTHWTARKFHGYLRSELNHEVGYSTVVRWLHENNFRLKVPQPWPDRQDESVRAAFVEQVGTWLKDTEVELWYCDETGVEGDPRPRRRWAKRGEKTRITKNGDHMRTNVCGAVCPRDGVFYALEFSHSDTECFQAFLDHASNDIKFQRPINLLICDNASWHKSKKLKWGKFTPVFLPPYSPDLNPIERLWLLIKAEWFSDFIAKTREQLSERIGAALCWAIDRADLNKATCPIRI